MHVATTHNPSPTLMTIKSLIYYILLINLTRCLICNQVIEYASSLPYSHASIKSPKTNISKYGFFLPYTPSPKEPYHPINLHNPPHQTVDGSSHHGMGPLL